MPRQPRLNLPGLFYHVMARGIEQRPIFHQPSDYRDFLKRLTHNLLKSGCQCLSWALMSNHLHLLIRSGARGIVALMHPLLTGYATAFNHRYRRAGHLFQNRYKGIVCQEDPYLLELTRYIPLNPVRAGLVGTLEELAVYPWTSFAALMGRSSDPWFATDEVLLHFGKTVTEARTAYRRFVVDAWGQGHRDDLEGGGILRSATSSGALLQGAREEPPEAFDARILGDGSFVEEVLRKGDELEQRAQAVGGWTLDELAGAIARVEAVNTADLRAGNRTRAVSRAKSLLISAGVDWMGKRLCEMAEFTRMSPGCASRALARGRSLGSRIQLVEHIKRQ